VVVGADHAGYKLKEVIKEVFKSEGIEFLDVGTMNGTDSVDYPDFAANVARRVASGDFERGVIVCGTGVGVAISANKVHGIRAANCNEVVTAKFSRQHNDANVLTIGSRIAGIEVVREILKVWLTTEFEGGRHASRVEKIHEIEKQEIEK
jgi:ribose 5-phosphate isomerase B